MARLREPPKRPDPEPIPGDLPAWATSEDDEEFLRGYERFYREHGPAVVRHTFGARVRVRAINLGLANPKLLERVQWELIEEEVDAEDD